MKLSWWVVLVPCILTAVLRAESGENSAESKLRAQYNRELIEQFEARRERAFQEKLHQEELRQYKGRVELLEEHLIRIRNFCEIRKTITYEARVHLLRSRGCSFPYLGFAVNGVLNSKAHSWDHTGVKNLLALAVQYNLASAAFVLKVIPQKEVTPGMVEAFLGSLALVEVEDSAEELSAAAEVLDAINSKDQRGRIPLNADTAEEKWRPLLELQHHGYWRIADAAKKALDRTFKLEDGGRLSH